MWDQVLGHPSDWELSFPNSGDIPMDHAEREKDLEFRPSSWILGQILRDIKIHW